MTFKKNNGSHCACLYRSEMAITAAAAAVKIFVQLHEGDVRTTKIWRFEQGKVYSKGDLCTEVKKLFPRIVQKGLIKLHHQDEIAGSILIESDEDMQEALTNFIEESQGESRKEYLQREGSHSLRYCF